jgi:phosphate starvation-inducible protein PhoH and related proteins
VRVTLRGDALTLSGSASSERARPVGAAHDRRRPQRLALDADDVLRMALTAARDGPRRASRMAHRAAGHAQGHPAQDAGAGEYLADREQRHRRRHRAGRHGQDVPRGRGGGRRAGPQAREAHRARAPAVEAGESLGFLPGDMQAKVDPYLRPLYDALEDMMPVERVQRALETRTIEIAPLAYMRGRTLGRRLRDPRRGAERHQRADEDVPDAAGRELQDGDHRRQDADRPAEAGGVGLVQVERILPGIEGIAFHYFSDADVIRHRLVREIIKAYAEDATG